MTQVGNDNPPASQTSAVKPSAPLVSVVIPAYNATAYIANALQSVFAQTFSDFEVLLVNDGSADKEGLEHELQPYLSRIRYFKQVNRGPSAARNLAIRESQGRLIAFLDADDFWLPEHLARQVERLGRNHKIGLVYANAFHLRNNRLIGTAFERVPQSAVADVDSLLSERCTINTSSVVASRNALFQAGLFDESMRHCEDFDLWLRLARLGVGIEYDRQVQVGHRVGNGLAASRERMKEGRAQAYKAFLDGGSATDSQRAVIASKLKVLDFEIHVELAKKHLVEKQYSEAVTELKVARSVRGSGKLRFAEFGLLCFPSGTRFAYRTYVGLLAGYKKREERRFMKAVSRKEFSEPMLFDKGRGSTQRRSEVSSAERPSEVSNEKVTSVEQPSR
jgi:glycosyltransferase involved in cell wall biosynthesis